MKVRVSVRSKTGEVSEVEGEGADYQMVKAGLLERMPDELQMLMVRVDR